MKAISTILCVLLILLQFRLWIGNGSLTEVRQLRQEKRAILQENAHLQARNDSLAAEVLDLKDGLEAIEERARSDMGMIKQDETFYQFIGAHRLQPTAFNHPQPTPTEQPVDIW